MVEYLFALLNDRLRPRWRRVLLFGGIGALVLGLLGAMLSSRPDAWTPFLSLVWRPVHAVSPPQRERPLPDRLREFNLTVGRVRWELAPGRVVDAYAYNGQIPGPVLRAVEGDTVRVSVTNTLTEPTTIHWHGVAVPAGMDGVPELSQAPIPPGGSFTYEFVATPAGTRWYHAHVNEQAQQGHGLAGALIVEPRHTEGPQPDREYVLVMGQWAAVTGTGRIATPTLGRSGDMDGMMGGGMGNMMVKASAPVSADAFTINGKTYPSTPALTVRQGERVRLRLINAGTTDTQAFALAGHKLRLTHSDGNPLARPVDAGAVTLGVGERADVEFVAVHPGRWQLRGLMPGHADHGLAIDVVYAGHEGDPVRGFSPGATLRPATYADFTGPTHLALPDRTYELTLSGGMMGSTAWTINGRSYPQTEPLIVRRGERVRLKLFNMSMVDHPMHLHGHTFQIVGIGGRPVNGPLKDTLTLHPMEQYEIEFVANNPGRWLFHCHNLVHMDGGLMAEIQYR